MDLRLAVKEIDQQAPVCVETQVAVQLNDEIAVLPRKTTARMMTAAINATMTAYSTAVAPRSLVTWRRVVNHPLSKRTLSAKNIGNSPPVAVSPTHTCNEGCLVDGPSVASGLPLPVHH